MYLDARECPDALARYINDCRNPRGHNVRFDKRPEEGRALVVATRRIRAVSGLFFVHAQRTPLPGYDALAPLGHEAHTHFSLNSLPSARSYCVDSHASCPAAFFRAKSCLQTMGSGTGLEMEVESGSVTNDCKVFMIASTRVETLRSPV